MVAVYGLAIMEVIKNRAGLRSRLKQWRFQNPEGTVALVPTMGYLHAGHLALIERAREEADLVVVSIFINPLQFNDPEDYQNYPIDLNRDEQACEKAGADIIFAPDRQEMYPEGEPLLHMSMPALTANLCGTARPGHFEGVLMVVARLLNCVHPDLALFGKKDYQQYLVIRRMVQDLDLPVRILGVETVREEDGRAMSSRNARLSPSGVQHATLIYRAMQIAEKAQRDGNSNVADLKEIIKDVIESGSLNRVDYIEIVDPDTLESMSALPGNSRFLIAVAIFCENVRLIDNILCEV